jgi:predicted amidohydrolase
MAGNSETTGAKSGARDRADLIKVAAVQMEPKISQKKENLGKLLNFIDEASGAGARVIVLPECALTGYVFQSQTETAEVAEMVPGPSTDILAKEAKQKDVYIVVGMIEVYGLSFYNVAVLIGPEGIIVKYRKMHPWFAAESDWPVTVGDAGQGYPVFETGIGKIGMMICYDAWITEPARILALNGADIIAFPTNSVGVPAGIACSDHILQTRALENHVWVVSADRIGTEREVPFAGRSQIIDVYGDVMVEASEDKEEIIYADIDPSAATRDKMLVPDLLASDLWWIRRPDTYSKITSDK